MSYNFPTPERYKPGRKPNRWRFVFGILLACAVVFRIWPAGRSRLSQMMQSARKPATSKSGQSHPPSSGRASQVPRVGSLPPQPRAPQLKFPKVSPRQRPVAPQVTPPLLPAREHAPEAENSKAETSKAETSELTFSNLPLRLPGNPQVREVRDETIRGHEAKIAKYPVFALYRALAAHHLELGNSGAAAKVFRIQAGLFRRKGLEDAALILEKRAAQLETTIRVFAPRDAKNAPFTAAALEPRRGCYLGAFIDRDDALSTRFSGDNWQNHRLPSEFEARVGRRHATVFTYVKWGNFPRQWLLMCKREGVIPHIAWEPQNLAEVRDDVYLRSCAQFLRELDWPVFVRFAGEMNGDWTPYHGNPALYRDKFRLVNRVLHRYAAKVATIWCVNAIPLNNIQAYYPGDEGCDWVGVNFYSTPFADNDRSRAAFKESPLALLDPIYRRFSARKPIAICEYAASHQSAVDGIVRTSFATEKMALLYGALPLIYPRVKMIDWFSTNNLIHARAGRQLNNYRLTEYPEIEKAYLQLTASPHFLTAYSRREMASSAPEIAEIGAQQSLRRGERCYLWVTSTTARPMVFVQAGTRVIYAGRCVGKHVFDLKNLPNSVDSLAISVFDGRGRCVKRRQLRLDSS